MLPDYTKPIKKILFSAEKMPVFANRVFDTEQDAIQSAIGKMELVAANNGLVYNSAFDNQIADFDETYDNQQKFSAYYNNYLQLLIDLILSKIPHVKKVTEIGCGSGYFIDLLAERGIESIGYDPSYKGNNPRIVKDYFSAKYATHAAELIVMRHVLYAVPDPFELLHTIAKSNRYEGKIYIEVLDFEHIAAQNSFLDICYEQIYYFTKSSLSAFFTKCETGNIFGNQYFYLIADLKDLKTTLDVNTTLPISHFEASVEQCKAKVAAQKSVIVWGAGGKGVSFVNLVDTEKKYIPFLIDVYPGKQNKFIAPYGHKVHSPEYFIENQEKYKDALILVVNPNYLEEVKNYLQQHQITNEVADINRMLVRNLI
jgi:SAM-dependent methyltransferase